MGAEASKSPPAVSRDISWKNPPSVSRQESLGADGFADLAQQNADLEMFLQTFENHRQTYELRISLLSELNTQTMLVAGIAFAMLSSLELEAIRGASGAAGEEAEIDTHERSAHALAALYITTTSVALGASLWVLYSSNFLINRMTLEILRVRNGAHATDVQSLRANMVKVGAAVERRVKYITFGYQVAVISIVLSAYAMVVHLIPWRCAPPCPLHAKPGRFKCPRVAARRSVSMLGFGVAIAFTLFAFIFNSEGCFLAEAGCCRPRGAPLWLVVYIMVHWV